MSGDKDLTKLINIIERLEITARERDNELQRTREIIQRLQSREAAHIGEDSVVPELLLSSPSAVTSAHITTVGATAQLEPPH